MLFKCELCDSQQRPPARPIASLQKWIRFNQCPGVDIAYVPDLGGNMHAFLVMLDLATDFAALQWMISGGDRKPSPTSAKFFFASWRSEATNVPELPDTRLLRQPTRQQQGIQPSAIGTWREPLTPGISRRYQCRSRDCWASYSRIAH
eukprot:7967732-Pyramimonas_sp.AAC.1